MEEPITGGEDPDTVEEGFKTWKNIVSIVMEGSVDRLNVPFIDVLKDLKAYVPEENTEDLSQYYEKVSKILTIITNIGMINSVIVPAILGVKYMMGSVEQKAEYKKGLIPYIVGAILIFGICAIVKIMQSIGGEINHA